MPKIQKIILSASLKHVDKSTNFIYIMQQNNNSFDNKFSKQQTTKIFFFHWIKK